MGVVVGPDGVRAGQREVSSEREMRLSDFCHPRQATSRAFAPTFSRSLIRTMRLCLNILLAFEESIACEFSSNATVLCDAKAQAQ
ncbi:hypothetical protein ANO11243_049170 [Dothideomycetidae sp. 11243]|nr:hypothetical protein ANO11243_049170 [fungal sp. No.11243]